MGLSTFRKKAESSFLTYMLGLLLSGGLLVIVSSIVDVPRWVEGVWAWAAVLFAFVYVWRLWQQSMKWAALSKDSEMIVADEEEQEQEKPATMV